MSVRFAVGHGSSSTSRDDWWPSCYVPCPSLPFPSTTPPASACASRSLSLFLRNPASRNQSHSNILHLWNILESSFRQPRQPAIKRLFPLVRQPIRPGAFISGNIWLFGRISRLERTVPTVIRDLCKCPRRPLANLARRHLSGIIRPGRERCPTFHALKAG